MRGKAVKSVTVLSLKMALMIEVIAFRIACMFFTIDWLEVLQIHGKSADKGDTVGVVDLAVSLDIFR